MVKLNATGEFIFKMLSTDTTVEDITAAVMKEYEVDEATAAAAVEGFISNLRSNNLIIE